jgi:hypothetical protein
LLPLLLSATYNTSVQSFNKPEPMITNSAIAWSKNVVNELNTDELSILNNYLLLVSNPSEENGRQSEENGRQLDAYAQSISENPKLLSVVQQYYSNAAEIIQTYVEHLENKFANLKSGPEDESSFYAKLEEKVYELFAYINTVYYNILSSYNAEPTQRLN